MKHFYEICTLLILVAIVASYAARANSSIAAAVLIEEHVYGGLPVSAAPAYETIFTRTAYIVCYNSQQRVPEWVAYHITPDYLNTPQRDGRFKSFYEDPGVDNPVKPLDYEGLFDNPAKGYVRGHLAPYKIAGGDRDGDGLYANLDPSKSDNYDEDTIREINYMSNVVPQYREFNEFGLWRELEAKIQNDWVSDRGMDLWIIAGCVLGLGSFDVVGPESNIQVPAMLYKIVLKKTPNPLILAFLFPQQREKHGHIEDFLVSVDAIEALTGIDFFPSLRDSTQAAVERKDTFLNWRCF